MKSVVPLILCLAAATSLYGATLIISPATIYDCLGGNATATLTWSGASGPVDVRVLKPDGPSMTGTTDPSGSATTGNWVSDGMQFFLVNQSGIAEAVVTAKVRCGSSARTIETGLAGGSYVPLQVGNTWVYRVNNRAITNDYVVRTITGTQIVNGLTYYVVTQTYPGPAAVVMMLRGDDNGVTWQLNGSTEQVYLDPNSIPRRERFSGLIGTFDDALTTMSLGFTSDTSIFVRGVGLVSVQTILNAGSSGGFFQSLDLVEARLDGVVLALPAARLSLAIENPNLDVSNQKAPNCTVPCYFVACGLVPGADRGGTYRPCAETRVESSYGADHSVQLQLFNPSGTLVYDQTADVSASGGLEYFRLPLYTAVPQSSAFTVLPPGVYRLTARMLVAGVEISVDSLTVRIQ
jgi:hypothetical protein